jgi:hypothetical protein
MILAGDALWPGEHYRRIEAHLWIVLSDPKQDGKGLLKGNNSLLLVNFTTWDENKDQTCIVGPERYHVLTVRSCLAYYGMKETTVAHLELAKKSDLLISRDGVSPDLLKAIREGAYLSDDTMPDHKRLLVAQGLIDPELVAQNPIA